MANEKRLYTVKWPKSDDYVLKSISGVLVESNVQRQIALHFYNEVRELEEEVQFQDDGQRMGEPREVIYTREMTESILMGEATAVQLRDILNTLFPVQESGEIN